MNPVNFFGEVWGQRDSPQVKSVKKQLLGGRLPRTAYTCILNLKYSTFMILSDFTGVTEGPCKIPDYWRLRLKTGLLATLVHVNGFV